MNDKYYKPKIEEFYVGFEFQYSKDLNCIWKNEVFKEGRGLTDYVGEIHKDEVRVKCLDEKDIITLGFKKTNDFPDAYHLEAFVGMYKCYLIILDQVGRVIIKSPNYIRDGSGNYKGFITSFSGKIKNKSELKKLMQQLDIK